MKAVLTVIGLMSISLTVFGGPRKCLTDGQMDSVISVIKSDLQKNDYNSEAKKVQQQLKALTTPAQLSHLEAYNQAIRGPDKLTLAKTLVDALQSMTNAAFGGQADCHEEDTKSSYSDKISWSCNKIDGGVWNKVSVSTNDGAGFFTAGIEKHVGASKMPSPVGYSIRTWYSERYGKMDADTNAVYVEFLIPSSNGEDFSGSGNGKGYRPNEMDSLRKDIANDVNYQCQP